MILFIYLFLVYIFSHPPTLTCRKCNFRFIRKYAKFQKMAEQGPMAIAMRLRNQLQSVYKLDPLRNEVSCRVLRDRLQRDRRDRAVELQQRRVVVVSAGTDGEERENTAEPLRRESRLSMRAPCGSTRGVVPPRRSGVSSH